jgi:hypothetical protein
LVRKWLKVASKILSKSISMIALHSLMGQKNLYAVKRFYGLCCFDLLDMGILEIDFGSTLYNFVLYFGLK